jgi:hypothetical protein
MAAAFLAAEDPDCKVYRYSFTDANLFISRIFLVYIVMR